MTRKIAIEPELAAREIITKLFRGKKVIIPGRIFKILYAVANVLPYGLVKILVRNIYRGVN